MKNSSKAWLLGIKYAVVNKVAAIPQTCSLRNNSDSTNNNSGYDIGMPQQETLDMPSLNTKISSFKIIPRQMELQDRIA